MKGTGTVSPIPVPWGYLVGVDRIAEGIIRDSVVGLTASGGNHVGESQSGYDCGLMFSGAGSVRLWDLWAFAAVAAVSRLWARSDLAGAAL